MNAMSEPIHLSDRALVKVSGPDWRSFLQGLVTQNVETLVEGELRYSALLSPQGRILFDLFLLGEADGCLIDAPADGRPALIQRLKMYRLRAKVEVAADDGRVAAALDDLAPPGVWIVDPRNPALGRRSYGAEAGGDVARYEAHRLSLGVPGPADWGSDKLYALEANLDLLNAIDFYKGCFIGQETASRMKRRGQIKSRTLAVTYQGAAPPPGTEVRTGDHRAGEILSGADGRALALLRLDRIGGGEALVADGRKIDLDQAAWLSAEISSSV